MGAVIFPAIPMTGSVDGKLDIRVEKFLTLDELLTHLPTAKAFLDELSKKGLKKLAQMKKISVISLLYMHRSKKEEDITFCQ